MPLCLVLNHTPPALPGTHVVHYIYVGKIFIHIKFKISELEMAQKLS